MDPKIKELAPVIWQEIEKAQSILLHCHYNPDCDSIGSALATMHALLAAGKKVTVIKGDSDLPKFALHLPGSEKIVLKNYFEIDLTEFDLFLILDSGSVERISKVGEVVFPEHLMTVAIDHHATNTNYAKLNLIAETYPATAQIMFDLLKEWPVTISPAAAKCLLAGLNSDTGGYKYRHTDSYTFTVASQLAKIAPDFGKTIASIEGTKSLNTIRFVGYVLNNLEVLFEGKVVIGSIDFATVEKLGLSWGDTHQTGLSSMLRDIDGVEISFLLIEGPESKVGISARSRNEEKYDVSAFLKNHFQGGGHKAAAGATSNKSLTETKAELVTALTAMLQ
jgi:phosphoesterase RecJ-like protein